jgi:hypothetical protein
MNDLTALRDYGPDAEPAPAAVLAHARSELTAEINGGAHPRITLRRTGVRVVGVLAAACVALLAIVLVTDRSGPHRTPHSGLSLVAFQVPAFPYSLRTRPAELQPPSFDGERGGRFTAHYRATDGDSVLHLIASPTPPDRPRSSQDVRTARDTTFGGHPALLITTRGTPDVELSWEWSPGHWIDVVGDGRFGTEAQVRTMAALVVAEPQAVRLQVHLAPDGWVLDTFKDGTIVTLADPHNASRTLSVSLKDSLAADYVHQVMGGHDPQRVSVDGHRGDLVRSAKGWALQAPIGHHAFDLQAPAHLAATQVVRLAESVSLT